MINSNCSRARNFVWVLSLIFSATSFADTAFTVVNNSRHDILFNDVGWHTDLGRCSIHRKDGVAGTRIFSHQQSQFFLEIKTRYACRGYKGIIGFADTDTHPSGIKDYLLVYMNSLSDGNVHFNYVSNPNSNIKAFSFTQGNITFVDW